MVSQKNTKKSLISGLPLENCLVFFLNDPEALEKKSKKMLLKRILKMQSDKKIEAQINKEMQQSPWEGWYTEKSNYMLNKLQVG